MIVAIMQPYFMPYLGYFQLINAADHFVYLDDVNFIKRGWINRNCLLKDGQRELFSIPLKKLSQNKYISQIEVNDDGWQEKLLEKIRHYYGKAPQYPRVAPLLDAIVHSKGDSIAELAITSIEETLRFLGLPKATSRSSRLALAAGLRGQDRLIAICSTLGADQYVNTIGGLDLYHPEDFSREGISLRFLQAGLPAYPQFSADFEPGLSIIDVLMFNRPAEIISMLDACSFITPESQA